MLNNNKRRDVCTRLDQQMYLGKKYRQDKKTGYYVCTSGNRKRLHVAMWEAEAGVAVPPGCVIHHVDWNKGDNVIENLVCVTVSEHERIHNTPRWERIWGENKKRTRSGITTRRNVSAYASRTHISLFISKVWFLYPVC